MDRRRLWQRASWLAIALAWTLACASRPPPPAHFEPLLWRAEAGGPGGGVLYLLGSVHVGTHHALELGNAVERAWESSDELVVEVDLSRTPPSEMARLSLAHGSLPEGRTLADVISPECWQRLVEYLDERGLPLENLEHREPWLVTATLSAFELQGAGYEADLGVDQLFLGRAAGQKPIVALETVESQLAMLESLPPEIQELMLLDVLARQDRFQREAASLISAWAEGDEEDLADVLFSSEREYPELAVFFEKVFFERNDRMSARLAEMARDGRTRFVVLGAGHMVGPRGIPAQLAKRGFAVERMRDGSGRGEPQLRRGAGARAR